MKALPKILSIFLLVLLLVNVMALTLVKVHYEVNKEYISQNRCINKDITSIQCYGKCFLNKAIDVAQKAKGQDSKDRTISPLSFEYIMNSELAIWVAGESNVERSFYSKHFFLPQGSITEITHPPSC